MRRYVRTAVVGAVLLNILISFAPSSTRGEPPAQPQKPCSLIKKLFSFSGKSTAAVLREHRLETATYEAAVKAQEQLAFVQNSSASKLNEVRQQLGQQWPPLKQSANELAGVTEQKILNSATPEEAEELLRTYQLQMNERVAHAKWQQKLTSIEQAFLKDADSMSRKEAASGILEKAKDNTAALRRAKNKEEAQAIVSEFNQWAEKQLGTVREARRSKQFRFDLGRPGNSGDIAKATKDVFSKHLQGNADFNKFFVVRRHGINPSDGGKPHAQAFRLSRIADRKGRARYSEILECGYA